MTSDNNSATPIVDQSAALTGVAPPQSSDDQALDNAIAQLEGKTAAPEAPAPAPEPDKATDPTRLAIAARRAQKAEREAKQRLQASEKSAQERIQTAERERDELSSLLKGLSTKQGLDALLSRAGIDFNTIARASLDLDAAPPDPIREIEALKKQVAEQRLSLEAERKADQEQRQKLQAEQSERADLSAIATFAQSKPDQFELLQANSDRGAYREVLKRATTELAKLNITSLTEEQRIEVLDFFCQDVEDDLFKQAQDAHERLSKLKKLRRQPIQSHQSAQANDALPTTPDSDEAKLIRDLQDTSSARYTTKFLTNDPSLATHPVATHAKVYSSSLDDDAFERLLSEHQQTYRH